MNHRLGFRLVVLAHALTNIVGGVLLRTSRDTLPSPLREYAAIDPPITGFLVAVGAVLLILGLTSILGLLAFWRPSRMIYLTYLALALLMGPAAPPVVQTSRAGTALTASAMLGGLAVGLMFFSRIADEFTSPSV